MYQKFLSNAKWLLAGIRKEQGKIEESRKLALESTDLALRSRGDQHKVYIASVAGLKDYWGINPDGTEITEPDESEPATERESASASE